MVKALVIVAHPDDETIWCGGTILMHPDWDWNVLCLCRRNDKDRAPKFSRACRQLNAKCGISDLDDEHPEKKLKSLDEVKMRINRVLEQLNAGKCFDFIFTHGKKGEYGHNRHVEVHRAVKEMFAAGQLKCKKIFFFSYELDESGKFCVANTRDADEIVRLSAAVARAKHLLITSVYGFNIESFEELSARDVESFKVDSTCDQ